MSYVTMKQMLETGVHFGHQTRRWNPKMRPYIFGARNGIHIIDLQKTVKLFRDAHDFVADIVAGGGSVIFVGTKRQAQESVKNEAKRCEMFFITNRWLGGTLTNFETIKKSIDRLKNLEAMFEDGTINKYNKKEVSRLGRELKKLQANLGGIKDMDGLPQVAFVIDPKREDIAVRECRRLNIPIVAVVDTNCDPDLIDHVIPGNDDAIRAIKLFATHIADAALEGMARRGESTEEIEEPAEKPAPKAAKEPAPVTAPETESAAKAQSEKEIEAEAEEAVEETATEEKPEKE